MIVDIRSLDMADFEYLMDEFGEKKYRAKQIFSWIHEKKVRDYDEMTSLSKSLREKLYKRYGSISPSITGKQISERKDTIKYLFTLSDGESIESVWMRYEHGNSVCISSQVGCRMGCVFCASTRGGLIRNLTVGEMLSQIYEIARDTKERIDNVIVMGMGEPLDNYDTLVKFIKILTSDDAKGLGARSITVSSCGLIDKIRSLADEGYPVTLAISLHASNEDIRKKIMPIAKSVSMDELFNACKYYFAKTGRRITFEYSMISGVNDSLDDANTLSDVVKKLEKSGVRCHVNLIPLNAVDESIYKRSDASHIRRFKFILEKNRINVTIRREMGAEIDAACGQLRNRTKGGIR